MVSPGKTHDLRVARQLNFEPGTVLLLDRVHPSAEVIGDVAIGERSSVWCISLSSGVAAARLAAFRTARGSFVRLRPR